MKEPSFQLEPGSFDIVFQGLPEENDWKVKMHWEEHGDREHWPDRPLDRKRPMLVINLTPLPVGDFVRFCDLPKSEQDQTTYVRIEPKRAYGSR